MPEPFQFVFSVRSPYAWIAARCVVPKLPDDRPVRWVPFYPLPEFTNFPHLLLPQKLRYTVKDVTRLAEHYGLPLHWPPIEEPDWAVPHAGFVRADELGRGPAFALALYRARFERGQDLGLAEVIERAAAEAELDPGPVVEAAFDAEGQRALAAGIRSAYDDRGIFGVPTLITPWKTRFWGHDRIEWALREGQLAAPQDFAA